MNYRTAAGNIRCEKTFANFTALLHSAKVIVSVICLQCMHNTM